MCGRIASLTLATAWLYKNIEYFPALIDRAPQVDKLSVNLAKDFIEMPSITTRVAQSAQPPRVLRPKLHRPEAHLLRERPPPPSEHEFGYVAEAQADELDHTPGHERLKIGEFLDAVTDRPWPSTDLSAAVFRDTTIPARSSLRRICTWQTARSTGGSKDAAGSRLNSTTGPIDGRGQVQAPAEGPHIAGARRAHGHRRWPARAHAAVVAVPRAPGRRDGCDARRRRPLRLHVVDADGALGRCRIRARLRDVVRDDDRHDGAERAAGALRFPFAVPITRRPRARGQAIRCGVSRLLRRVVRIQPLRDRRAMVVARSRDRPGPDDQFQPQAGRRATSGRRVPPIRSSEKRLPFEVPDSDGLSPDPMTSRLR